MRRFWDGPLRATGSTTITIGRAGRLLFLEQDADLLDGLRGQRRRRHAARRDGQRLPELALPASTAPSVPRGRSPAAAPSPSPGGMAADGDTFRVVPDFEDEDMGALIEAVGFAAAAQPYAFWVTEPIALDPLTVVDDRQHLRTLTRARNLPEFVKRGLPRSTAQTIALPDSAAFLVDAGPAAEPLRATTVDLPSVLSASGPADARRSQADRRPGDRAAHGDVRPPAVQAGDARHRSGAAAPAAAPAPRRDRRPRTMGPEIEFHAEVTSTLNSLRDLHTGYRLPAAVRATRWPGCRSSSRRSGTAASRASC